MLLCQDDCRTFQADRPQATGKNISMTNASKTCSSGVCSDVMDFVLRGPERLIMGSKLLWTVVARSFAPLSVSMKEGHAIMVIIVPRHREEVSCSETRY
ncbi:MAG: hypothetical protein WCT28_01360 [Patescibacteria group bacterium]